MKLRVRRTRSEVDSFVSAYLRIRLLKELLTPRIRQDIDTASHARLTLAVYLF